MVNIKNLTAPYKTGFGALCLGVVIAAAWSLFWSPTPAAAATPPANFVYRTGTKLMLNGSPYKFVGYNAFGVTGCEGRAWTRAQLDAYFAQLPPASMTRLWATEMYGTGTLDQVVASAEAHNQKVILTINNDLNDCVGDGPKNNAWYQSGYKNGGFLNWARTLANKYKNSPAIGMWEVINEAGQHQYSRTQDRLDGTVMKNFYQAVASTIKSVDPNHLIGTGDNASFVYKNGITGYATASSAVDIDVLSLHDYESDYVSNGPTISTHFAGSKNAAEGLIKPIIIGEMNDNACKISKSTRAANVKKSIDSYLASGAAGVLVWNHSQVYYNDCANNGEDYIITPSDPLHTIIKAYSISGNVTTPTGGCAVPANYGAVSSTLQIPADGVYQIWSRIMASSTANNSYSLEIDGKTCIVVGDSSAIPVNTWAWVNYRDGDPAQAIKMNLTRGTHNIRLIGREAGVKVDRVLALADMNCTPVGTGDQCAITGDTTLPTAAILAPAANATVAGNVSVNATATDNVGVTKVEFYIDGALAKTATGTPYTYAWNAGSVANGAHTVAVKAYDAAGNVGTSSVSVTVGNGDLQAPSVPANAQASAASPNEVRLSWGASTDNIGVTGYLVSRGGALVATVTNGTAYVDRTVAPNTQYNYQIVAYDAVGNKSAAASAAARTPQQQGTADTQAPAAPKNLVAKSASSSQVNLTWSAATDNVAVTSYDVYRAGAGAGTTKIATVTGTTFGDSNLKTGNVYTYFVIARDAAGNSSVQSNNANATPAAQSGGSVQQPSTSGKGVFRGTVKNASGQAIQGATVTLWSSEGGEFKATTNSTGVYRFDNLSTTAYFWANFTASGYQDQGMTIQVDGRTDLVKNVQLQSNRNWWQWW